MKKITFTALCAAILLSTSIAFAQYSATVAVDLNTGTNKLSPTVQVTPTRVIVDTPETKAAGIEPDEIDVSVKAVSNLEVTTQTTESKGKVEYTWKVEEGTKAAERGTSGTTTETNFMRQTNDGDTATTSMTKADIIVELSNRAGYIKIGDIKGESTDGAESANKPKEIVVVGSRVRNSEAPNIVLPELSSDMLFDENRYIDADDVGLLAVALAQRDENIETVKMTENDMVLEYQSSLRLFGFIEMPVKQTVTVEIGEESDTRVKVKMPWWHIFGKKTVKANDILIAIEEEAGDSVPTETLSLNYEKIKFQYLETITDVLKTKHDSAMASIQNVK